MRIRNTSLTTFSLLLPLAVVSCGAPPHRTGGSYKLAADAPGDPAHNLLKQRDFNDGVMLPWLASYGNGGLGEAEVKDGALCAHVKAPGKDRWDAQVRHREMTVEKGHTYVLSFKAWASRETKLAAKVGMSGPPYKDYLTRSIKLTTEPQEFAYQFQMKDPTDPTAELAYHFGGGMIQGEGPIDICFDDIVLSDPKFTPPPPPVKIAIPSVRVNQHGYLPKLTKIATVVDASAEPLVWKLLDASGQVLTEGKTQAFGADASSGDNVHVVDFSSYQTPGTGLVLEVSGQRSDAFEITERLYEKLTADAFKFFYHARSGVEIKMPFAGADAWARPAGHPKDVAACAPGTGCDYQLDVTGGWYDAGDHGKYVVNGGISVWTLLNYYEASKAQGRDLKALGDGAGLIPESGNKVPDVLDEARWNLDFMLRMQVPDGQPLAGMVHHKMHDDAWTALGLPPHLDTQPRHLRAPSTAATLNVAATAAQGARIWKTLDPAFSARCLAAAEKAWQAAKKQPAKYALPEDTTGGGPYDDADVSDEFYWAAAELFITTGKDAYKQEVLASKYFTTPSALSSSDALTWQRVDLAGSISLATVPSTIGAGQVKQVRDRVVQLADNYLEKASTEGYRVPFKAGADGYPWGSNSSVLNNALVLALAYDFTKQPKYRDGVVLGLDYLLGRNALGQSYVSGYGERPLLNPHHRFFAHQANPAFPSVIPGVVSGGPNSGLQDPYAKAAGLSGCKPQKCFVDHIEAWSTNEVTINWNSPLTWIVGWLDGNAK
jgi:endoglucanase